MGSVTSGFRRLDPTTGQIVYDPAAQMDDNVYNQYAAYRQQNAESTPLMNRQVVMQLFGLTPQTYADMVNRYDTTDMNVNPKAWEDAFTGYGVGPQMAPIVDAYGNSTIPGATTYVPPTSPTQTQPQRITTGRPETTRTGVATTQSALTRGQMPQLAVDPSLTATATPTPVPATTSAMGTANPNARRMTSLIGSAGASTGLMPSTAAIPTLGSSGQTGYDPQAWSTQNTTNPFINSSGGFAYDALPGMYNYLMQYLGENANLSSGVNNALTQYLGQNLTSDYPQQMSEYLQQLIGGLGSGQMQFGTDQQTNAANQLAALTGGQGTSTPIQQQVQNTLSQLIGGSGLSPEYVAAAQESILKPALENTYGTANNMAGGVGELSSGLAQELARRTQSDFSNQLIQTGYENLSNFLNQGNVAGATSYNQGLNLANLTGDMSQNAINNTLNSMSQGQNLMGTLLNSLLGLQGNAQNYTTALTGQYGNLAQGLLSNKTAGEANSAATSANKASTIGNLLGSIASGITGGSGGSGASSNLSSAWNAIKKLLGIGDDVPFAAPQNPDQPTGGSINDIISGIPFQDMDLYNQLNEIMGGTGNYIAGNVNDFDWNSLLEQSGITGGNTAVDWGSLFSDQPSTYQYYDTTYDSQGLDDWLNYMTNMFG